MRPIKGTVPIIWGPEMARTLNSIITRLNDILSGRVTFRENMAMETKEFTWNSEDAPKLLLCKFPKAPRSIMVLKAEDQNNLGEYVSNPAVTWSYIGPNVSISAIDLPTGINYNIELVLLEE